MTFKTNFLIQTTHRSKFSPIRSPRPLALKRWEEGGRSGREKEEEDEEETDRWRVEERERKSKVEGRVRREEWMEGANFYKYKRGAREEEYDVVGFKNEEYTKRAIKEEYAKRDYTEEEPEDHDRSYNRKKGWREWRKGGFIKEDHGREEGYLRERGFQREEGSFGRHARSYTSEEGRMEEWKAEGRMKERSYTFDGGRSRGGRRVVLVERERRGSFGGPGGREGSYGRDLR